MTGLRQEAQGARDPLGPGGPEGAAMLDVVRGDPSPEELAAVVAVVAARAAAFAAAAAAAAAERGPVPLWSDRARNLRSVPHPGPGAWRSSARPV